MNKVILLGRLSKDPEVRYSQSANPLAVCRYSLAVSRSFKREGEPDADFIDCVAFGKNGEFAERFFKKGMMVAVEGAIRTSSWEDKETKQRRYRTEVILDRQYFAESKASFESRRGSEMGNGIPKEDDGFEAYEDMSAPTSGFSPIAEDIDDDELPF